MDIQIFIDRLKVVGEREKQRIIDAYLEEVNREEEIMYNIEYYLKRIEENIIYLEEPQELQRLIILFKGKLEEIKVTHKDRLEV